MKRYCQTGPNRGEAIGEEEILSAILEPIGMLKPSGVAVDIGASDGAWLSNTKFLEEYHGFTRYLFDADGKGNPAVIEGRITVENVRDVFAKHRVPKEPTVFSLDVDGYDWHLLKAMLEWGFRPAVGIYEFQGTLDPLIPVTIPYDPSWTWTDGDGSYFGASWSAIKKLNESMGYTYVTQCGGLNAFFVRNGLVCPAMPFNPAPPKVYRYHRFEAGEWLAV